MPPPSTSPPSPAYCHLNGQNITALRAGDFDGLTALEQLWLDSNSLTALPDGVFDELTALESLYLQHNPAGSFAPMAEALPDNGTVSHTGGTVTLDGSGSNGGPWGTNVFYAWELTPLTSGVTFDDNTSVTPVVTIPALPADTELTFTLTVTGRGDAAGEYTNGIDPGTDTATVTVIATGICGRTQEVRDALLRLIETNEGAAVACADVTDDHLAAITGPLDLSNRGITALAAGDFAGLTALTELNLNTNALTSLPTGVFAGLTSLRDLWLNDNMLTTLPDDVFEPLTLLTDLRLSGNPEAPFRPVAVALPDDGTVSADGGTLTLDGSDSDGGPWGTNVTYSWALTPPASGVTVTFDDDTSVTPEVTIPKLGVDDELTFTLTVTGQGGTSGTAPGTDTATVTAQPAPGICGRTQEVRDALLRLIENNEGAAVACADVTDDHLAAITGPLNLRDRGITALAAGDFAGLTALTELNLNTNALTSLSTGVFAELPALTTLHLARNALTLSAGDFAGLTALTELNLNGNELTTLSAGVFDGLPALTTLHLIRNALTSLSTGVFAGLPALTTLDLSYNNLTTLTDDVFKPLPALETLYLFNNALTTLPDDVFKPLPALETLNLLGNREAPFRPVAAALPDNETVSSGGTVTLDGSGSGGAWGTNVFYALGADPPPTSRGDRDV